MLHEPETVLRQYRLAMLTTKASMSETLARGYLKKLLENGKVVRFLAQKHRDLLSEFQHIIEAASLES